MVLYSAVSSPLDRSKCFTLSSPDRPVYSDTNSTSLGSILAIQQLRNDYSLTCPPLTYTIVRYSFTQLSQLGRREENENAQTSKRYQRGFEPGLSRLRVRHSTTELPRSISDIVAGNCRLRDCHWRSKWRSSYGTQCSD